MGDFNHRLIIDSDKIKLIKQEDIIRYALRLNWKLYATLLSSKSVILNSPKFDDKENFHQIIVCHDSMHDVFQRTWDSIQKLAEYHGVPYTYIYDHIMLFKDLEQNGYDRGKNMDAICSWGEGPDDVMLIGSCYGKTTYYDLTAEHAERLGNKLIQSANHAREMDKVYEEYLERENKK